MSTRGPRFLAGVSIAGVLALSLAGCNKAADSGNTSTAALPSLPATLPMTTAPVQQAALAPPPGAIRAAQPIRTVRVADPRAAYAYADQASYFSHALGSAPPDYGFDYDGVRPYAWQGDDGSRVFTEPVDGGYRYYYYRAGAEQPYFVRDPDYGYGYDDGQLAVVYGPDGGIVPYADYGPRIGYAGAYLWRAERLYEASRARQAISAQDWAARQDAVIASRERWAANRDRQADWAAYHAEEAAQQSQYWAREAERRDADQQRFADWRQQDFRTPPPPRAIPERWQQADWARDSAHYAPVVAAAAGAGALAYAMHRAQAPEQQAPQRQAAFAGAPPQPNDPRGFRDGRPGAAGYDRGPAQPPQGARWQDRHGPQAAAVPAVRSEGYGAPGRPPEAVRGPDRHGPQAPAMTAARPVFAGYGHGGPRGMGEPARGPAPQAFGGHFHQPAPERRAPPVSSVTVHEGGRPQMQAASFRPMEAHAAPAPRAEAPHTAPPRERPAEAPRAMAPAPRMAAFAPPHGGGHPGGEHPGGGGGHEHHR
jgi:hypothetical protein